VKNNINILLILMLISQFQTCVNGVERSRFQLVSAPVFRGPDHDTSFPFPVMEKSGGGIDCKDNLSGLYMSGAYRKEEPLPKWIPKPTRVPAAGNIPKQIEEFIGRLNSGTTQLSVARMKSPAGWSEPGQRPEFDEFSLVLSGRLRAETHEEVFEIGAGEAFVAFRGEWVRYSSPHPGGAEYIAVCLPAFSPETVHRDP